MEQVVSKNHPSTCTKKMPRSSIFWFAGMYAVKSRMRIGKNRTSQRGTAAFVCGVRTNDLW